jgi:hypothetical protein
MPWFILPSGGRAMPIAEEAKEFYVSTLQAQLEAEHPNKFVAIEPESKSYYIADTFVDAALAAKMAHPDRKPFVIRIGHEAAFHIGANKS